MTTRIKTTKELEAMRVSGRMLANVLKLMQEQVEPGLTGKAMARLAAAEIKRLGGQPAFLNYQGFPDVICISLNDEVVHGIPDNREFQRGDVIGFDFGVNYQGMITDAAVTVLLGDPGGERQRLVDGTRESLMAGIKVIKGETPVGTIAAAIQKVLDRYGFGIVRELVGHGVGHELHEDPNIPNYGTKGEGFKLLPGMTVALEPMSTLGHWPVRVAEDGWTIKTRDESLSAHFEHTVLVTESGYEILTQE